MKIEHIVYINLDSRTDRREHMEAQLEKYGLTGVAERFAAIANPGFGIWGCGQSHLAVLKSALERGWDHVLIFEDDFEFVISPEEFHRRLTDLPDHPHFDVLMMAYNMRESEHLSEGCRFAPSYQRVLFAQTASAYLVKESEYDALIELYERVLPLLLSTGMHWLYANDVAWKPLQEQHLWIAPIERWGKQMDGYSDNAQEFMSYNC